MTALLGLLGMSAVPGKMLRIYVGLAVVTALVAGALYGVHYLTAKGYDQAARECGEQRLHAQLRVRDLERDMQEDLRDNAIAAALRMQSAEAGAAAQKQEVLEDVEKNPSQRGCGLDANGLRLWNQSPGGERAGDVRVRPGSDDSHPGSAGNAAGSGDGRPGNTQDQSRGFKARASAFVDRFSGAGQGRADLHRPAAEGGNPTR
jgi:hypothetical protein